MQYVKKIHAPNKGTDGGEKLTLHCLLLGESAPNENGVVGNFMWNLVGKACQSSSGTNQRGRVERCGHAVENFIDRSTPEVGRRAYARPSVL